MLIRVSSNIALSCVISFVLVSTLVLRRVECQPGFCSTCRELIHGMWEAADELGNSVLRHNYFGTYE